MSIRDFVRETRVWILAIPLGLMGLGAGMNQTVKIANHQRFPVLATKSLESQADSEGMLDEEHCLMTKDTKLNWLADVFDFGDTVYSLGDGFVYFGEWLWGYTALVWVLWLLREYFTK